MTFIWFDREKLSLRFLSEAYKVDGLTMTIDNQA